MAKKEKKGKEPEAEKPAAEGAEGEAAPKKKLAGKTLVLFIILPALLVVGGGGAAAMMLLGGGSKTEAAEGEHGAEAAADGHGEKKADKKKKDEKKKDDGHGGGGKEGAGGAEGEAADVGHVTIGEDGEPSYYTMPKIIVNLASTEDGDRPQLLELSLVLESGDAANFDNVADTMPRLKDTFQSFLRELRVEDLDGSQGSYRLRLELLKRFNLVMAPDKIDAVLIEGMLVQ